MKYRLKQDRNAVAIYSEGFKEIEAEIVKHVRTMSFYRSHKEPVLAMGHWPGIALWKIKVLFTTGVETDFSYKTEEVKE